MKSEATQAHSSLRTKGISTPSKDSSTGLRTSVVLNPESVRLSKQLRSLIFKTSIWDGNMSRQSLGRSQKRGVSSCTLFTTLKNNQTKYKISAKPFYNRTSKTKCSFLVDGSRTKICPKFKCLISSKKKQSK